MTAAELIEEIASAGLKIKLSASGGLTLSGSRAAAKGWLPTLRERKAEIVSFLKEFGNQPAKLFLKTWIHDATFDEVQRSYKFRVNLHRSNPAATSLEVMAAAVDFIHQKRLAQERRAS
jgi:hypothetical protein